MADQNYKLDADGKGSPFVETIHVDLPQRPSTSDIALARSRAPSSFPARVSPSVRNFVNRSVGGLLTSANATSALSPSPSAIRSEAAASIRRTHPYLRQLPLRSWPRASTSLACADRTSAMMTIARTSAPSTSTAIVPNPKFTVAVNATPTRAGGLLVSPESKTIYFYSIGREWSRFLSSLREHPAAPDKFEMMNALLALHIFGYILKPRFCQFRRRTEERILLKMDNNVGQNIASICQRETNPEWKQLFEKIDFQFTRYSAKREWEYGNKANDPYLKLADRLSRADHSESLYLPMDGMPEEGCEFLEYRARNLFCRGRFLSKEFQQEFSGLRVNPRRDMMAEVARGSFK